MHNANYTSSNISRALGLGGFENDFSLARAKQAIRILFKPSFHPEVCITLIQASDDISLSVVVASSQIWLQNWPTPQAVAIVTATAPFPAARFELLKQMLLGVTQDTTEMHMLICDGMQVHCVLRIDGVIVINMEVAVGSSVASTEFAKAVVSQAWEAIDHPKVRNALSEIGRYTRLALPLQPVTPAKQEVRILVLGSEDESSCLLTALKELNEREAHNQEQSLRKPSPGNVH